MSTEPTATTGAQDAPEQTEQPEQPETAARRPRRAAASTETPETPETPAAESGEPDRYLILTRPGEHLYFAELGVELVAGKPLRVVPADAARLDRDKEVRAHAAETLVRADAAAYCNAEGDRL